MKRWTMVLIAGLLLFSLACSVFGGAKETPTTAATSPAKSTEASTPEALSGDDTVPPTIASDALEGLDSYRSKFVMRSEYDDGAVEELSFLQEAIREPYTTRMVMETVGGEEDSGAIEIIQIGATQYMSFGGEWMQSEVTDDQGGFADNTMINYNDVMSGLEKDDYDYIGKETINGIKTKHYRANLSNLEAGLLGIPNVSEATSEFWVSDDSKLPVFTVRFIISFKGEPETGRPGRVTMTQDVYDVNVKFTIAPPADALAMGLPEDVPGYPDATEFTAMSGFISFHAPDNAATVTAFYDAEMPKQGWEKDPEDFFSAWEKEDRRVQLMISDDEDKGGASVVVTITVKE